MSKFSFRIWGFSLVAAVVLGLSWPATGAASCCGQDAANLSPEKQALVEKLYEDFHNGTLETRRELFAKRRELDSQMYSAQYDENKIQALAKEISELRAKLYSARIALQTRLIKEGVEFGYGGCGQGMGRGGCGGFGAYGPGMGRGCGGCGGFGPGMGRGGCGGGGAYGPGMGRGPGPGGANPSCCDGSGGAGGASGPDADGRSFGTGSGMRGRYGPGGGR